RLPHSLPTRRSSDLPHHAIYERIFGMRWPIKRALTEPVMRKGQRQRYQRNAEIIARMLTGFATATSHAPARTGGYQPTFQTSPRSEEHTSELQSREK